MNNKGDVTDITLFLILIFFLAISLVVALFANTQIKKVIDETPLNQSSAYSSISASFNIINTYTTQRGFVLMFAILCIGMLVSAWLIKVHPIFLFLYILTLGFAIFIAALLANTYALFVANDMIADFSADYSLITWVMRNIIRILLAVGILSIIIIFGKAAGGAGEPF